MIFEYSFQYTLFECLIKYIAIFKLDFINSWETCVWLGVKRTTWTFTLFYMSNYFRDEIKKRLDAVSKLINMNGTHRNVKTKFVLILKFP